MKYVTNKMKRTQEQPNSVKRQKVDLTESELTDSIKHDLLFFQDLSSPQEQINYIFESNLFGKCIDLIPIITSKEQSTVFKNTCIIKIIEYKKNTGCTALQRRKLQNYQNEIENL